MSHTTTALDQAMAIEHRVDWCSWPEFLIPENLRIRRSRILRAPQLACSRFTLRMKFST